MIKAILTASLVATLSATAAIAQPIIHVDAYALGANDGTSWTDAYTDLQSVLGGGGPGEPVEVWVADGTYFPGPSGDWTATFHLHTGVALYGGFAGDETSREQRDWQANVTILSGDIDKNDIGWYPSGDWNGNQDNVFHVVTADDVDATAILDGFQIIRGASNYGGHTVPDGDRGSGLTIHAGSPVVANCTFRWNTASFGAAVHIVDGSPTFTDCVFTDNLVWWNKGAGICNLGDSTLTVTRCDFLNNITGGGNGAGGGAGIFNDTTAVATITGCRFVGNESRNFYLQGNHDGAYGAGIFNLGDNLTVVDCLFDGNFSHAGSGIYTWGRNGLIVQCLFQDNTAVGFPGSVVDHGDFGGALACRGIPSDPRTTRVVGSVFVGNSAGEGGAVAGFDSTIDLHNSILWGNTATGEETAPINGQVKGDWEAAYSCVEFLFDVIPGEDPPDPQNYPGSIDGSPLFVDLVGRDLRLAAGSPCIDAGDNAAVPAWLLTDFAGLPRITDDPDSPDSGNGAAPIIDMGIYEFVAPPTAVADGAIPSAQVTLRAAPNPFGVRTDIDVVLPDDGGWAKSGAETGLVIEVYDVRGSLVRELPLVDGSDNRVAWDGRDRRARPVPAGTYFLRLRGNSNDAAAKVLVVR